MKSLNTLLFIFILTIVSCKSGKPAIVETELDAIENSLLPSIQIEGDSIIKFNLLDRMEYYNVPGVSIAIVEDSKIKWAKGYGIANTKTESKVDTNTIFQAGSISKPIAALAALKLVEDGLVELDEDVNTYLKGWKIPESKFTSDEKVTLRKLLTHTAGMTVHGFPGYKQTDTFPSITQVLKGNGNTSKIFVDIIPGSIWRYSGGGYTVMEKVVEDVSGKPLEVYLSKNILEPIGMKNSTYEQPLNVESHKNISAAYDNQGDIIEGLWHNYPEQAAAGLWTTPTDLAKYCIEIQNIIAEKKQGPLSKATIDKMLTKHKNNWGLGPSLQWANDSLIFRHGGKNAGFTNTMVAFANRGTAVIIMTNADNGGTLMGELLRSVSNHYNMGISKQRVIKPIHVSMDTLKMIVGTYKLNFQVPNIGDYIVDISIKDDKLFVNDPNNGETNFLVAIGPSKFIDPESGHEMTVQLEEGKQGMLFNNRFQFNKIEE